VKSRQAKGNLQASLMNQQFERFEPLGAAAANGPIPNKIGNLGQVKPISAKMF